MINRKSIHQLAAWLSLSFFLLACVAPYLIAPLSTPLPQTPIPGLLETIVAQTAAAAQTETVTFLPSLTLTSTSTSTRLPSRTPEIFTSTPTFILVFPGLTQAAIALTPQVPVGQGQIAPVAATTVNTLTSREEFLTKFPKTPKEWDCRIIEKSPPKGTRIKPKSSFYISWLILNNGTKTWTNNGIDFVYTGGYRSDGRPIQDLRTTVAPGKSIKLNVLLTAPKAPGTYNTFWSLKVGRTLFCHMKLTFEVN